MSEAAVVEKTNELRTRKSLADDLIKLGLKKGSIVIVHSSLSELGWVCGGAVAVIQALMDVVTDEGTLVMPAHSGDYSDPCYWQNPPVPEEWWALIRENMPAYEPEFAATRGIGIIPETFRKFPGVLRSSHPVLSFSAWGREAAVITLNHSLDNALGEESPLAKLYALNGEVLLLGADYDSNTSFHLAEYRAPDSKPFYAGTAIIKNGTRVWQNYLDIQFDSDCFIQIGMDFEKEFHVITSKVGSAETKYFKQRDAVDFATRWLTAKRKLMNEGVINDKQFS